MLKHNFLEKFQKDGFAEQTSSINRLSTEKEGGRFNQEVGNAHHYKADTDSLEASFSDLTTDQEELQSYTTVYWNEMINRELSDARI